MAKNYHIWNPDDYLMAFIFIMFAIGSSIFTFLSDKSNTILILFAIILFSIEFFCSYYFFKKWRKEYRTNEYKEHKKINIMVWLVISILIVLGITMLNIAIDNYINFTTQDYYSGLEFWIEESKNAIMLSSFILFDFIYLLIYCIIYVKFYKKYKQYLETNNGNN